MHTINRRILAVFILLVSTVLLSAQTRVYQSITDDVAIRVTATVEEGTTTLRSFYAARPQRWVCEAFPDRLECTLDFIIEGTITPAPSDDALVFTESGRSHRFLWESGAYRRVTERDETEERSTEIHLQRNGTTVSATFLEWREEGVLEFPTRTNGQYRYSASDSESVFINVSDEEIAIFNPAYPEEFRVVPRATGDASLRIASVLPEPPRFPDLSRSPARRGVNTARYTTLSIESTREITFDDYTPVAIDPSGNRVFALRSGSAEQTTLALLSLPEGRPLVEVVLPFAYRPMLEHVAWSPSGERLVTSTRSTFYADESDSGLLILDGESGTGGFVTDNGEDSFPFWIDETRFGFLRYDPEASDSEMDLFVAEREVENDTSAHTDYRVEAGFPNVAPYLSIADIAFLPATGTLCLSSLPLSGRESGIRCFTRDAVEPALVTVEPFSPAKDTIYFGDFDSSGRWGILWPQEYLEAGPTGGRIADTPAPSIVSLRGDASPQALLPDGSAKYLYAATLSPDERAVVYATFDPRTGREALVLRGVDSGRIQGPPITLLSRTRLGFDPFQSARSYQGSLRWTGENTILYIRSDLDRIVVIDLAMD